MTFELDAASDQYDIDMRECIAEGSQHLIDLAGEYALGMWDLDEYLEQIDIIINDRRRKQRAIAKKHDKE